MESELVRQRIKYICERGELAELVQHGTKARRLLFIGALLLANVIGVAALWLR